MSNGLFMLCATVYTWGFPGWDVLYISWRFGGNLGIGGRTSDGYRVFWAKIMITFRHGKGIGKDHCIRSIIGKGWPNRDGYMLDLAYIRL